MTFRINVSSWTIFSLIFLNKQYLAGVLKILFKTVPISSRHYDCYSHYNALETVLSYVWVLPNCEIFLLVFSVYNSQNHWAGLSDKQQATGRATLWCLIIKGEGQPDVKLFNPYLWQCFIMGTLFNIGLENLHVIVWNSSLRRGNNHVTFILQGYILILPLRVSNCKIF